MRRRVVTSQYGGWIDPSACFAALASSASKGGNASIGVDSAPLFWLDSGVDALTGMSCMGVASRIVTQTGTTFHESSAADAPVETTSSTIFDFLRTEQAHGIHGDTAELGFALGWVGWLGYELHEMCLNTRLERSSRYPDAAFVLAETAIVFDHAARTVTLVALGDAWTGELVSWRDETLAMLHNLASDREVSRSPLGDPTSAAAALQQPAWAYTDDEYLGMIQECQRSIRAGDAYQLCLTTEVTLAVHPDPVQTYLALRELSPSHHGGFLRIGEVSLLSSSPEKFLTVSRGGEVESKPIKGTRKRGETEETDAALRAELVASDKERAENLMIVDLVRNDLSRICDVGSVAVPALLQVESYAQVHQLVSTVRGTLAAGKDAIDAVTACFPAGSMTGAPKISAVEILDRLERRARGMYSGAWGYFGFDGSVDLAMTIRSIVIDAQGVSVGTGGGITALSVPEEELEETRIKVGALLRALGLVNL